MIPVHNDTSPVAEQGILYQSEYGNLASKLDHSISVTLGLGSTGYISGVFSFSSYLCFFFF